jgi:uncharacterized protein
MEQVQRTVEAPANLGTDIIAVPEGQLIELDLRLESVVEGVLVTGSARATANGACVRCLDPVDHKVDVAFQELFAYADRAAHHRAVGAEDDESEEYTLEGDLLDLEAVLRDAVVPALPFQPVCRDDCPGLCSQCGERLADDPGHQHEVIDPRWSALQALSSDTPSKSEEKRN